MAELSDRAPLKAAAADGDRARSVLGLDSSPGGRGPAKDGGSGTGLAERSPERGPNLPSAAGGCAFRGAGGEHRQVGVGESWLELLDRGSQLCLSRPPAEFV